MRHPAHATSELIDVVNLVTQAFWAELRRSGPTIEMSQWSTLRRIGRTPCTMSELARHKGVGLADHLEVGRDAGAARLGRALGRQVRSAADAWSVSPRPAAASSPTAAAPSKIFLDQRLANLSAAERKAVDASLQLVRRVLTVED